jgi:hypothetical protein
MKYEHIGWCREGTADKVWGIILLQQSSNGRSNQYVSFWGRRGSRLQTKLFQATAWQADDMFEKKQSRGYRSVDIAELGTVYPEFQQDLEKTAVWAMLKA